MGKQCKQWHFIFWGSKITVYGDCSHEIKRLLLLGSKVMTNLDSILKSRDMTLPANIHLVKAMIFPIVMYGCELDYKESWVPKNWWFWTEVLEKTLESPLDSKEIQPVHPKGNQFWIFIGRTNTKAETPIPWPPAAKNWLWKIPWCWERFEGGRRGVNRGWDGWMASPTQWTWVWVNSGSWWWTGRPGVLQSMASQGQTRLTNWTEKVTQTSHSQGRISETLIPSLLFCIPCQVCGSWLGHFSMLPIRLYLDLSFQPWL